MQRDDTGTPHIGLRFPPEVRPRWSHMEIARISTSLAKTGMWVSGTPIMEPVHLANDAIRD